MSVVIIIPARWGSTRFPGKPLARVAGRPMIQHVYERCLGSGAADTVIVATDSEEIRRAVVRFGGHAVMTSPAHPSGTDRVAEAALKLEYDIIVNVQGDEPLIRPEDVDFSVRLLEDERASVGTLAGRISQREDLLDPNVVKVAIDGQGFAAYFSRAPIPYHRDGWKDLGAVESDGAEVYRHIGLYSYRREALLALSGSRPSRLEVVEKLEQLRALELGMRIKVGETDYEAMGVDTPGDLGRVERCLSSSS